jgi:hypothetical protein
MLAKSEWASHFGDNDLLGWVITLSYLAVAVLCARAALATRRAARRYANPEPAGPNPPPLPGRPRPTPWWVLSVGALLMGLNKQLDVQILVRELGIALIAALGYDEHRRWFGRAFLLALGVVVVWAMVVAARHMRHASRGYRTAMLGLAFLACFAVVRAGKYVPFLSDVNLNYQDALHLVFELGGLVLIGASAWRTRRVIDRSATTAPA